MALDEAVENELNFEVTELVEIYSVEGETITDIIFAQITCIIEDRIEFVRINTSEIQLGKTEFCNRRQLRKLSPILGQTQQDSLVIYAKWLMRLVLSIRTQ